MTEPEADRCDIDEAEVAFGGFVVSRGDTAGILEFVEAPFHQISLTVDLPIVADLAFAVAPRGYHHTHASFFDRRS